MKFVKRHNSFHNNFLSSSFCIFWGGYTGVLNSGLALARQALYQYFQTFFALVVCQIGLLTFCHSGLKLHSSYIYLPCNWNYSCAPLEHTGLVLWNRTSLNFCLGLASNTIFLSCLARRTDKIGLISSKY
jgi:hypothetical protein